ncbi:M23 family peptidase [Dysgonomonas sp. 521]|uniref:murein hydrolase activator EnvC family protein n=1 Tax=Dysgonomonas sp. 521 TaxID=2302932 RepID=UPI0013D69596|nr:M23 family metallopeptidase [Dysgonomonas sp. 521]NDV95534.1 M23 family peptidase [Dysgonomonas sp. 521]
MAKKKKNKHNFWKRLHFKYRLSVMNENTLEEVWTIKASMFSGAVLLLVFAVFLITVTSIFIIATPVRYYLPGYLDAEVREKALRSAIRVDSLQQRLNYQEAYINNLKNVFEGVLDIDSVKIVDDISISENDPLLQRTKKEKAFVDRYEEEERYNLSVISSATSGPMEGVVFFRPLKGLVVNKFNPLNNKYGVTLKVVSQETVSSVLEGTVVFSGYDLTTGYTVQIQHKNGFISIYKNNTLLLKKSGDKVLTGEAIAVIGDNKNKEEKDFYSEFELWYKGNPVNPEDYIAF